MVFVWVFVVFVGLWCFVVVLEYCFVFEVEVVLVLFEL